MTRKLFIFELLTIAASAAAAAILYPHLPGRIPLHWNLHGQPNGYGPRASIFLVGPGLLAVMMLLTAALPWLSPRRFDVNAFRGTYAVIMCYVFVLMAYIDAVVLWVSTGHAVDSGRAIIGAVCLFFAVAGNLMGKVRRNFYMGVRTPWTLASERVWNSTHRFAARTFVLAGLLGLGLSIFGLQVWPIVALAAGGLAPVVYSLVEYKRLERHGQLENGASLAAER
jgi:uncharacterized membrane protein